MRLRTALVVLVGLLVFPLALLSQQSPTLTESTVVSLYRGTSKIEDLPSWDACQARARELARASTQTSGTVTYSCKTEVRKIVATYSPATPGPVNCVVSAFSLQSFSPWTPSPCTTGQQQTRSEVWARTVTTPASNGGTACPALTETRTGSQACSTQPPLAQCGDKLDNDKDGLIDFPADPGCTSATDNDETNTTTPPASLLFEDGWDKTTILGCNQSALNLLDNQSWDDYGGSGACSGTVHDADVVNDIKHDGPNALRVNQKAGNVNGTDFRIVKAFGNQTSATVTYWVYYEPRWVWASADHKMWIWMDQSCTSQNVYINWRGGSDSKHARIAIHVLPSDTVFADNNVQATVGRWYRIRSYVVAGAQGKVEAWLMADGESEVKLNLVHDAGNQANPNQLNTGSLGCGKLDTTYNAGSNVPASGMWQLFDTVKIYRGLFAQ